MMNQISKFSLKIGSIWLIFPFASGSKMSLESQNFDCLSPSLPQDFYLDQKREGWVVGDDSKVSSAPHSKP